MKAAVKNNIKGLLCVAMVLLVALALTGCGSKKGTLVFTGKALDDATVGSAYTASVATAEGTDGIQYNLKAGSALPAGLALSADGTISGTPSGEVTGASFAVVASQSGFAPAEATFTLTVLAAQIPESAMSNTFEAEFVDLTDKAGAGPSNAALETELVLADASASNGHYIGYTYFTDLFFDFVFTADSAKEATLKVVMGSDLGAAKMNPSVLEIAFNDAVLSYDEFKLSDSSGKVNKVFKVYDIGQVNLVEGENKVTIRVLENELYNGATGGPLIDCIVLDTQAALSWSPVESNVK